MYAFDYNCIYEMKKIGEKKLILKNDNTMYAIENNCIYELERIEHIWNYAPEKTITYHERY